MDDSELARARRVIDALREVEGKASPGPWRERQEGDDRFDPYVWASEAGSVSGDNFVISSEGDHDPADVAAIVALRNAAGPLLALAEAARRVASIRPGDDDDEEGAWWIMGGVEVGEARTWCLSCGEEGPEEAAHYAQLVHDPDCPAVELDRALANLAALAP